MEMIDNILYISHFELVKSEDNPTGIISEYTYRWLRYEKKITVRRACYGTPALIEYKSLPLRYREKWEQLHGDPEIKAKIKPFIERIKPDVAARDFFNRYAQENGTENGEGILSERKEQYINDASILNALRTTIQEMRERRGGRINGIWDMAIKAVDEVRDVVTPCGLPKTAITLKRKAEKYFADGYESLVHQGYRNKNSIIINDEVSFAFLTEMLNDGRRFDSEQIADTYNLWAGSTGRRLITGRTVNNFKIKYDYDISMGREGYSKWADKYDLSINRKRPSAPMLLVNSDDNDLDLYYRAEYVVKEKGKLKVIKNNYFRYVVYVVLDAHCDYILGYALGMSQTKELVKEAYRDAMRHVKELTGSYYLWHQIVSDRWGISKSSDLLEFYQKQALFTPPRVGLARSKVIERSFGKEWHKHLKLHRNYAGPNIGAKQQINADYVAGNIKDNPTMEEGVAQIANFIHTMRNLSWKSTGMSREQVWLSEFKKCEMSRERCISDVTYLEMFGKENSRGTRITNKGISVTIGGDQIVYDVPANIYRHSVGKKVRVIYDDDLSRVLVTDGEKLQFIATENKPFPMAIKDYEEGDGVILHDMLETKEKRRKDIKSEKEYRQLLLEREMIDANSYLQAGILVKEIKQDATATVLRGRVDSSSNSSHSRNESLKNLM